MKFSNVSKDKTLSKFHKVDSQTDPPSHVCLKFVLPDFHIRKSNTTISKSGFIGSLKFQGVSVVMTPAEDAEETEAVTKGPNVHAPVAMQLGGKPHLPWALVKSDENRDN